MTDLIYQMFDNKEEAERFRKVFLQTLNQTVIDLSAYYEGAYSSRELGQALYDGKLTPVYRMLAEELFVRTYYSIMDAQATIGTPDAYCQILYGIFGSNATITIDEKNPLHIMIDIIARSVDYFLWVNEEQTAFITTEAGDYLGFNILVARLTNRQLADVLQNMTNAGTFLEFTFKQEEPEE